MGGEDAFANGSSPHEKLGERAPRCSPYPWLELGAGAIAIDARTTRASTST